MYLYKCKYILLSTSAWTRMILIQELVFHPNEKCRCDINCVLLSLNNLVYFRKRVSRCVILCVVHVLHEYEFFSSHVSEFVCSVSAECKQLVELRSAKESGRTQRACGTLGIRMNANGIARVDKNTSRRRDKRIKILKWAKGGVNLISFDTHLMKN